ncbi:TPA: type II toxin-antitoxin system Phd/YefM family antitoxin [Legionella pneumophila]
MMAEPVMKVGMREFREHLNEYVLKSSPVAVSRHGEIVGYYIPTKSHAENSDLNALKKAAENLDKMLAEHGVSEKELFVDFTELKSADKAI